MQFFRYVPHGFVHVFEAQGWEVTRALTGTHHEQYAVLMKAGPNCTYDEAGEPITPKMKAA